MYMYIYIYIYIYMYMYIYIYINFKPKTTCVVVNISKYKNINFSQIFRLFSKPSTVCVGKALDEKFTNTAEIKN